MYLVTYKSSKQITPDDFISINITKLFTPDTTLKQIRDWKQETDRTTSVLMSEVTLSEIFPPVNPNSVIEASTPIQQQDHVDVTPDKDLLF